MNNENHKQTNGGVRDNEEDGCKHRLLLPFMKTIDDAYELCRLEQDNIYISIYLLQAWLGHATLAAAAEYAEKKDPRTRKMQAGIAWRSFTEIMPYTIGKVAPDRRAGRPNPKGPATRPITSPADLDQNQICLLICDMFRSVQFEDPLLLTLREAIFRYMTENGGAFDTAHARKMVLNPVPEFLRLCEWLDCVLHQGIHMFWHLSPASFDPDPEKRELASLGALQRDYAKITDLEKAHWQWHFADAAAQYADSPKFAAIAATFGKDNTPRVWNYPAVDESVIALWPMVKRHNWTYADLLKVIRPNLKRPNAYPCDTEQSLATYCTNVLGLRKIGKGTSAKGAPIGTDIAHRLLGLKQSCKD